MTKKPFILEKNNTFCSRQKVKLKTKNKFQWIYITITSSPIFIFEVTSLVFKKNTAQFGAVQIMPQGASLDQKKSRGGFNQRNL